MFRTIILFQLINNVILHNFNLNNQLNDDFTIELLKQYHNFVIQVHFDNTTCKEIDRFINSKTVSTQLFFFNYDNNYGYFERDDGRKYLYIVYLDDFKKFENYSSVNYNLLCTDVVMFFYKNTTLIEDEFWMLKGIEKGGSVILYNIEIIELYFVKFFFGNLTGVPQPIRNYSYTPNLIQYINQFKDFNEHMFHVGFLSHKPFVWCRNNNSTEEGTCDLTGAEGDLLNDLSLWLNFNITLISFGNVHADYSSIIETINKEEIDWAFGGITLTYKRYFEADFGAPLRIESYVALISIPKEQGLTWGYIFGSFETPVWLCLLIIFSLLSILIKLSYQVKRNLKKLNNWEYFMIPIKAFISESEPNIQAHTVSSKLIYGLAWFVLGIIFSTVYKSKLTSIMIIPKIWQPQTVKELLDNGYGFQLMEKEWAVLKESANLTSETIYMQALNLAKDDLDYCDAIKDTLNKRVAFLQEETPMQYQVVELCDEVWPQYELLSIVNERIFPNNHAWPMQLAAPYVERFSAYFQRLQSIGYIERLYKKYETKKHIPKTNEAFSQTTSKIKMENLTDPTFLLLVGYALSIVIFIVEIVSSKWNKILKI